MFYRHDIFYILTFYNSCTESSFSALTFSIAIPQNVNVVISFLILFIVLFFKTCVSGGIQTGTTVVAATMRTILTDVFWYVPLTLQDFIFNEFVIRVPSWTAVNTEVVGSNSAWGWMCVIFYVMLSCIKNYIIWQFKSYICSFLIIRKASRYRYMLTRLEMCTLVVQWNTKDVLYTGDDISKATIQQRNQRQQWYPRPWLQQCEAKSLL